MDLFRRLVANLQTLLGIDRIYEMKLVHERVQQFLSLIFKDVGIGQMSHCNRREIEEVLCVATEQGHAEYITYFLRYFPIYLLGVKNKKNQNLFHIAAECRQYNVYNILCEFVRKLDKDYSKEIMKHKDSLNNNMLHTVARITPLSQIDHIQGATLQMQRELQWFKKVESIVDVKDRESVNNDKKTPREVFVENHKEMWKEAKNSVKETANSCTVVGALIITIMFAAIFTVPGGYDGSTGLPIFLTKKVFIAFMVSDALSLFSSTTAVIMFLGVITSRYNEDDFHGSLPRKMIIGLFTLFLSIATMMIVFSCALYIILDGKSSIVIPTVLLASVPLTSYLWMQFPLLIESFLLLDCELSNSVVLRL
ncbi:hypothetical protein FF2_023656 [Malus domestica]